MLLARRHRDRAGTGRGPRPTTRQLAEPQRRRLPRLAAVLQGRPRPLPVRGPIPHRGQAHKRPSRNPVRTTHGVRLAPTGSSDAESNRALTPRFGLTIPSTSGQPFTTISGLAPATTYTF